MFLDIRPQGRKKKYYLIHTYREGDKVKRISRYLGSDLTEKGLARLRPRAEDLIRAQLTENPYETELGFDRIKHYARYETKIELAHLNTLDWKKFTEQFTYNTNAIEGSSVRYPRAKRLIEKRNNPTNNDEQETLNVARAVAFIRTAKEPLSLRLILRLHAVCFEGTKPFAGRFRDVDVVIRDGQGTIIHRGAPIHLVEPLLNELVTWYKKHKDTYPPLLLAAIVHNQFETIHPFQDGNGRVGRLLLNYVLLQFKHPPINIRLKDRTSYYAALHVFQQNGDINPTLKFLTSEYKKQHSPPAKR